MKLTQKLQVLKRRYSRIIIYSLAFLIIMFLTVFVSRTSLLKPIDLYFYGKVYLNPENVGSPQDYFKFIDLKGKDANGNTFTQMQKREGVFQILHAVDSITSNNAQVKPPSIVLDVSFNSNTYYLDTIVDAIKYLNAKNIKVYGVYDLPKNGEMFEVHDSNQAEDLYYDYFEGGRLHTEVYPLDYGVLSYESYIPIMDGVDTVFIPALPIKVINDFTNKRTNDSIKKPTYFTLPVTTKFLDNVKSQTYVIPNDSLGIKGKNFNGLSPSDLSNKILVVGFNDIDYQFINDEKIPGPYLVGMAMWNEFNEHKLTNKPYENEAFHLGLEIFCALLVVFMFDLMFKRIRKLQSRSWLIAIIAFVLGLGILYLIGLLMLSSGDVIRPSVSILSMFWACILAWHFTIKFLVTGIMEGGEVYDVFISYSHGDSIWVKKNLFTPLNEIKKPDGSKLNIFFDEKSIGIGELFTTKYMRAIVDSKYFVPVMSEEYYGKNHCRNEMAIAVKRHVEKLIGLCILALDYKYVPDELTHINYVDVTKQTNFISLLEKELTKDEPIQPSSDKGEKLKLGPKEQEQPEKAEKEEIVQLEVEEQLEEKKEKKKVKKDKKKDKKKSDKKDKKDKKEKKKDKKKSKKDSKKKDKKEKGKKDKKKNKKESKKKDKKVGKKKDKKSSDKKNKKGKKKKGKKESKTKSKKNGKKKNK